MERNQVSQLELVRQLEIRLQSAKTYRRVLAVGATSTDLNVNARLSEADEAVSGIEQELNAIGHVSNAYA